MRSKLYLLASSVAVATVLAGCGRDPFSAGAPSYFSASIEGAIQVDYAGSGNFSIRASGTPDPVRFVLSSRGIDASSGEGFWFHSTRVPAAGARPIGALDAATDRAIYWQDEGNVRRIYRAEAGEIELTGVRPDQVTGSFRMNAHLQHVCVIQDGFPGPIIECEPAQEEATIEVAGTFAAGVLGGNDPGLLPSQW